MSDFRSGLKFFQIFEKFCIFEARKLGSGSARELSSLARLEILGLEARLELEIFFTSGLEARLGLDSSGLELGSVLKI